MEASHLLFLILGIVVLDYFLDQVLNLLNFKSFDRPIPSNLREVFSAEEYGKSQAYQKVRAKFGFTTSLFSVLMSVLVLLLGGFGLLDQLLREYITDPIVLGLGFFGVLFILSDLVKIPFSLYSTFVIEEQFGFNKTTLGTFILDKLKSYLLIVLIGAPLGYALLWLVVTLDQSFWVYALLLVTAFILIMNLCYTSLIMPLFNRLTPLEEGELKTAIEEYTRKVGFPLDHVYVIDGSKRSSKANAFFSGLGKRKKVVLYDTLIQDHSKEELVAVLAHEVGHYKKRHILQSLLLSVVQMAITFYVMSLMIFNENLSIALGADQLGIHLNFIAFGLLYTPISRITGLLMNMLSRKNEYEADAFAANTYQAGALVHALKTLSKNSLSNLTPNRWYEFVNYSHPSLSKRVAALESTSK